MKQFLLILLSVIGMGSLVGGGLLMLLLTKGNQVAQENAKAPEPVATVEAQPTIEVSAPVEAYVTLCSGPNMVKVAAAYDYITAQTERKDVIAKYVFAAASDFPESCDQKGQMATPQRPAVFPVSRGRYLVISGSVPYRYAFAEVRDVD